MLAVKNSGTIPEYVRVTIYKYWVAEDPETGETVRFDYITTTLTISPLKDAQRLNAIGLRMASEYGVAWLPSDFKKRDGYKRSIELSRDFGLYRQNYCGCVFSQEQRC